jgi:hypothetical protein
VHYSNSQIVMCYIHGLSTTVTLSNTKHPTCNFCKMENSDMPSESVLKLRCTFSPSRIAHTTQVFVFELTLDAMIPARNRTQRLPHLSTQAYLVSTVPNDGTDFRYHRHDDCTTPKPRSSLVLGRYKTSRIVQVWPIHSQM